MMTRTEIGDDLHRVDQADPVGEDPDHQGPAARPSRLLARVSVPKAVERIEAGVRFATIAPAGPAVPAAKNAPAPMRTTQRARSLGEAQGQQHERQRCVDQRGRPLRIGRRRVSRSVTMPQMIMPAPMSRMNPAAPMPALFGARW